MRGQRGHKRYWGGSRKGRRDRGLAAVLCVSLLGAWLLCAPAVAQAAADADQSVDGRPVTIFDQEWLSAAAMYVGVTVVCVGVFTLIFIKCWLDVGRSVLALDDGLVDPEGEPASPQPGGEPNAVPAAADEA